VSIWVRAVLSAASAAALTASLSSCGGGATGTAACSGTVTVATDMPSSGTDAAEGLAAQNGAQLAVTEADADRLLGDCQVDLITRDDASQALGTDDPRLGASNMRALVANPAVIGVVGPLASDVCASEEPVANRAGLVLISPACSDPGLTKAGSTLRSTGRATFFRLCATDAGEAGTLSGEAWALGARVAYIIDDSEAESRALGTQFGRDFVSAGGRVAGTSSLPGSTTDFHAALAAAAQARADLVFFAGSSRSGGGRLRAQMAGSGLGKDVRFMGAAGIVNAGFISDAGASAGASYASLPYPSALAGGAAAGFGANYRATYGAAPLPVAAVAFDAMNVLLAAVSQAIAAAGGSPPAPARVLREAVRAQVATSMVQGTTGELRFDADGDRLSAPVSVVQVRNGTWVPL